jgi:hypothetical protein
MNLLEAAANSMVISMDWAAVLQQGIAIALGVSATLGSWMIINAEIGRDDKVHFQIQTSRRIKKNAHRIAELWLDISSSEEGESLAARELIGGA